jgi:ABC-type branched-subunit amino acid transport system substrate-binding protein
MTCAFAGALVYDLVTNGARANRQIVSSSDTVTGGAGGDQGTAAKTVSKAGATRGGGTTGRVTASTALIPPGAPITIGEVVTQSGPLNASDAVKAVSAWVQTVNAAGGINGHKLILDSGDDNGDPNKGRSAFERIVQEDKALAVVGECAPLTDATIVDEINQLQVPVVGDCLTADKGYSSPYIWFNTAKPQLWQKISANYVFKQRDKLAMTKPYILCTNTTVTLEYCNGFVDQWHALGGVSCSGGKCPGDSPGYDSEQVTGTPWDTVALQIKSSGATSIFSLLDPNNQGAFLQALQRQPGLCPKDGMPQYAPLGMDPTQVGRAPDCSKGVLLDQAGSYLPSEGTSGQQQLKAALDRYEPGTPVDAYSQSTGWTPMVIFGEALRRLGPNNISQQNLINTLNAMGGYTPEGLCRTLTWTATDHGGPPYTRWAKVTGVNGSGITYDILTGWIDPNGNPA